MKQHSNELRYAVLAIVLITIAYVLVSMRMGSVPAARSLYGHLLGAVGLVFMLMTELLYSARKRSRKAARWGSMQSWLRFHVITGVVGPYMVLLHTSWRFNGLAGVVTLLTLLIVFSGFVGRYIYTAVPRAADGVELDTGDLQTQIDATEAEVRDWLAANATVTRALPQAIISLPQLPYNTWLLVFGRVFSELGYRWRWWRARQRLRGATGSQVRQLGILLNRRRELRHQIAALVLVRRVLALWHSIHVPLGIILFTLAFVHVGAAAYYVTLAR